MAGIRDRYGGYVGSIERESLDFLRALVGTNSFTHNRSGVLAVGALCREAFEALGFSCLSTPSVTPECGDHLILRRPGGGAESLVLVSHLDTVYPPEEEEENDFRWREEGGWIHGPGVADIKGGTVVMIMALRALAQQNPSLFERIHWQVLLNATEEGGCADFRPLARNTVNGGTGACFVYEAGFEMPGGAASVVFARKGSGRFVLEAFGRAAHSGHAHKEGASAIKELASQVLRIEALTDYDRDVTFNVGLIEGGSVVNSVPAHARCIVDMRARNPEDFAWGAERIGELEPTVAGCTLRVTERPGYPPWPRNDDSDRLGRAAVECGAELGLKIEPQHRGGASDGSHLFDLRPALDGLGCIGRNTHCSAGEQESARRDSFVERALLSLALFERVTRS